MLSDHVTRRETMESIVLFDHVTRRETLENIVMRSVLEEADKRGWIV